MTTNIFRSFAAFCEREGIAADAVVTRLASDARMPGELLVGLETGAIDEEQFEPRFAQLLGVGGDGLIDRLFDRRGRPDDATGGHPGASGRRADRL